MVDRSRHVSQQVWHTWCISLLPSRFCLLETTNLLFWFISVGSPRRSARNNSPARPSVMTSSFYGKQKGVYLTPLERKAVKESLPSRLSALSSPPQSAKKTDKKIKKAAKRGNKPRKSSVGSNKRAKKETRSSQSPVKTIQLTRCNTRFVSNF